MGVGRNQSGTAAGLTPWERAYIRFESQAQERRKFLGRLKTLGADNWPRDARIVELFCGRGNGMRALNQLGFRRVEGIDLSVSLLSEYTGPAARCAGDCRYLPLADSSRDILIVQGGLHHLSSIPDDLELCLAEARRVLRPGGVFAAVEPWSTPFLTVVHWACKSRVARGLYEKLDALATMIEHERRTYEQWLAHPDTILALLARHFRIELRQIAWGKMIVRCRKPSD